MEDLVRIGNQEISTKEFNNQRVVTFKDIDTVHERADGTARKRFNDNKKHFIEGTDFFVLNQPSEIRTLGIERPQGGVPEKVTLVTESGYLMLVKSFTDDLAWDVQRQLVDSYFRKVKPLSMGSNAILPCSILYTGTYALKKWIKKKRGYLCARQITPCNQ